MRRFIHYLGNKKKFFLRSEGVSMFPLFHTNDILYLKKADFPQIKTNDCIMVRKNGNVFIHRVIYKTEGFLITKGDNNPLSDGKVYPKQIIGKVYQIKRREQLLKPENIYLLQSTNYFQEIIRIKQDFDKSGINYVFLKGLPLHLFFEKSHPKRIYADCDALVNEKDKIKAEEILKESGYKKAKTAYSKIHELLKDKLTESTYYKSINDFPVIFDIHFEAGFLMNQLGRLDALYSQSLMDEMTEKFVREKRIIKIQDEIFSILSPDNLIIYLALHFFHHNYSGIFRLEFINKIMRKSLLIPSRRRSTSPGTSWYLASHTPEVFLRLSEKIKTYHLQNFVYPVFVLLVKYYKTPLPQSFLESIKPDEKKMQYIKKNILNVNIFDDEPRITAGVHRFKNLFFLSPYPLARRVLIVFNPAVIYSIFWVITLFFKRSLIKVFK